MAMTPVLCVLSWAVSAPARADNVQVLPPLVARAAENQEAAPSRPRLLAPVAVQPRNPASFFTLGSEEPLAPLSLAGRAPAACDSCAPLTPLPRLSLRHDFGEGVGFDQSFSYAEAFIPFWRWDASQLLLGHSKMLFADLRAVNFDDSDRWEFNAGLVERRFLPNANCVLGLNVFYDHRHTESNHFQQIGVGGEILGKFLEFRCNGYFIIGPDRRPVFDSGVVNQGVVNGNFVLNRTQIFEVARDGVEAEIGGGLPFTAQWPVYPRFYVGAYSYYQDRGLQTANGVRGRAEIQVGKRISLHFAIQNDAVFDTTMTGGVAIHFGAPAFRSTYGPPTWTDVIGQRVHRDINIVISTEAFTTTTQEPAPPPPPVESEG